MVPSKIGFFKNAQTKFQIWPSADFAHPGVYRRFLRRSTNAANANIFFGVFVAPA